MKKRKLKKWVKVVLTIVVLIISLATYNYISEAGHIWELKDSNSIICIMGWLWLFFGQIVVLDLVWEN